MDPSLLARVLPLLAILVVGTAVYSNTFYASFHFDDYLSIVDNAVIRDGSDWGTLWSHNPSRFVLYLSLAWNYRLGGLEVFGYHLVNLFIHLGAGLLVYGLVRLILASPQAGPPVLARHARGIALFTALLFVGHPIQTQAVTYIVQRTESLAAFFYLLALVLYVKARQGAGEHGLPTAPRALACYLGALGSALLGILTKEMVASLPAALFLYEICFLGRKETGAKAPSRVWPFLLLIPFLLLVIIPWLRSTGGELILPAQPKAVPRWIYLLTQFRVMGTYLRLLLFPTGQNLDYSYPVSHSFWESPTATAFLLLIFLGVLGIWLFRRWRALSFCIFWYFVTLSVTSSIIPIDDLIFEHRLYLTTMGYSFLLGQLIFWAIDAYSRRQAMGGPDPLVRRIPVAVCAVLVVAYSLAAYQRNGVWQDEMTLWSDCIKKSPNKARPHNNLGMALNDLGRHEEAIGVLKKAISLESEHVEARNNLGIAYEKLGRYDEAMEIYRQALELKPNFAQAHGNLGMIYEKRGLPEKALVEYQKAISLDPNRSEFHNNLGNIYLLKKEYAKAQEEYQKALRLNAQDLTLRSNMAALWSRMGDYQRAMEMYQDLLQEEPQNLPARNNLGFTYYDLGRWDEAIAEQNRVLEQDPTFANAYYGLAQAYEKKGMVAQAIEAWKGYLRYVPPEGEWARRAQENLERLQPGGVATSSSLVSGRPGAGRVTEDPSLGGGRE
ncbi:MAG: tetratricopeptide repeat protein [Candidatus Tectomicrobia bacterium]|uniref:Tetratricopeptide repeat protein n=1 Tax=Tectimicrobiota bacterium TaxID=2528274 RepID=A0A932CRA8_UNCTE|nr:tetratricopeptide repeat protein [Candidatus Tectomicrobia bacterium]